MTGIESAGGDEMADQGLKLFRESISRKGLELRELSYDTLAAMADTPSETGEFAGRRGTISLIVEPCAGERLRVVIQGFLEGRLLSSLKSVELDGFYKHRDGRTSPIADREFHGYD